MSFTNIANPADRASLGEMSKSARVLALQAMANMALDVQTKAETAREEATAASSRADVARGEARAALRMSRVSFTLLLLCAVITLLSADFGRTAAVVQAWWCTTVPGACLETVNL